MSGGIDTRSFVSILFSMCCIFEFVCSFIPEQCCFAQGEFFGKLKLDDSGVPIKQSEMAEIGKARRQALSAPPPYPAYRPPSPARTVCHSIL